MIKLIGFTQEVTTCVCCGKNDLKGTYQFDNGVYYVSDCAKKATGVSVEILKVAKKSDPEYDMIGYLMDSAAIELRRKFMTAPVSQLKAIKADLAKIKLTYKR